MNKIAFLFLSTILFISCQEYKQEIPKGTFYGILPCADCPGINYTITFENDSVYSEKLVYQERNVKPLTHSGTFSISENGIIDLTDKPEKAGMKKFKLKNDTLQMLDISGKQISGALSNRYLLTNKKPQNFTSEVKKATTAIGFKATGNEPFWYFEIDFVNKKMKYKPMEGDSIVAPLPTAVKPQDSNAVSYNAETEKGTLKAMIIKEECVDDMSGKESAYKVRLDVKIGDGALQTYTGCGEYKGDYRLHNLWVLESFNGKELKSEMKAPNIEFNLVENKLYGFGGCNRINGPISISQDSIKIGPIISTKMACPNLKTEQNFLSALSEKELEFSFSKRTLTLKNKNNTLIFSNVD